MLYDGGGAVIEQILSSDHLDEVGFDQDHDEWVLVLDGAATLHVDGETVDLASGDWLVIRAHQPHRIVAVTQGTSWLAVHLPPPAGTAGGP
jgi:cupin 2 domain-containing protein